MFFSLPVSFDGENLTNLADRLAIVGTIWPCIE